MLTKARKAIAIAWADRMTPSARDESPGVQGAQVAFHALLGGAVADVAKVLGYLAEPLLWATVALFAAIYILKEISDLRKGGDRVDGLVDTVATFAGLWGAFYASPGVFFGLLVLAAGRFLYVAEKTAQQ